MPVSVVSSVYPSDDPHIESLRKKHEILSRQIEEAQKSPSTRDFIVSQLKKQKLLVKEKLERFRHAMKSEKKS